MLLLFLIAEFQIESTASAASARRISPGFEKLCRNGHKRKAQPKTTVLFAVPGRICLIETVPDPEKRFFVHAVPVIRHGKDHFIRVPFQSDPDEGMGEFHGIIEIIDEDPAEKMVIAFDDTARRHPDIPFQFLAFREFLVIFGNAGNDGTEVRILKGDRTLIAQTGDFQQLIDHPVQVARLFEYPLEFFLRFLHVFRIILAVFAFRHDDGNGCTQFVGNVGSETAFPFHKFADLIQHIVQRMAHLMDLIFSIPHGQTLGKVTGFTDAARRAAHGGHRGKAAADDPVSPRCYKDGKDWQYEEAYPCNDGKPLDIGTILHDAADPDQILSVAGTGAVRPEGLIRIFHILQPFFQGLPVLLPSPFQDLFRTDGHIHDLIPHISHRNRAGSFPEIRFR